MNGTPTLVCNTHNVLFLEPPKCKPRMQYSIQRANKHLTESDTSSIHEAPSDETLFERISALQDMIPASTRRSFKSKTDTLTSWFKSGLSMGGKTLWVVSTSALLLGVPWALAYSEEQMIVEQERAELQAQRAQNEVRNIGDRRERMGRIDGDVLTCG
jgi:hypothetical protein